MRKQILCAVPECFKDFFFFFLNGISWSDGEVSCVRTQTHMRCSFILFSSSPRCPHSKVQMAWMSSILESFTHTNTDKAAWPCFSPSQRED